MRRIIAAAILLLLVPTVHAVPWAEVDASAVVVHGSSQATASLAALQLEQEKAPLLGLQGLQLAATALRWTIEHRDANLTVANFDVEPRFWSEAYSAQNVALATQGKGDSFGIFLAPLLGATPPEVLLHATDPKVGATSPEEVRHTIRVHYPGRSPLTANVKGTTSWESVEAEVTIQGDFQLVLWDITLEGDGISMRTGSFSEEGSAPGVQATKSSQAYLTAQGATLRATLRNLQPDQMALRNAQAATTSGFTFENVDGYLRVGDTVQPVRGRELRLDGNLSAQLSAGEDGQMQSTVSGVGTGAYLDAEKLSVTTTLEPGRPWLAGVWAIITVAGVGFASFVARRRQTRIMQRLEQAMARGEYARVAGESSSLLGSRRYGPEAAVLHATALLRANKLNDASKFLNAWPRRAYPWDRDFLLAHLYIVRGELDLATKKLRACLEQSPMMAKAVAQNPAFAPILASLRESDGFPAEGYS